MLGGYFDELRDMTGLDLASRLALTLCLLALVTLLSLLPAGSGAAGDWPDRLIDRIPVLFQKLMHVGLYAVPYSEPLSVLLSSPGIMKLNLQFWLNRRMQDAMMEYDELLDQNTSKEELKAAFDKLNKYQAVFSCISTKDCSRLREIEFEEHQQEEERRSQSLARQQPNPNPGTENCPKNTKRCRSLFMKGTLNLSKAELKEYDDCSERSEQIKECVGGIRAPENVVEVAPCPKNTKRSRSLFMKGTLNLSKAELKDYDDCSRSSEAIKECEKARKME